MLPYSLSAAQEALFSFAALHRAVTSGPFQGTIGPQVVISVHPAIRDRMSYCVDLFLDAARRAQNAFLPYLSSAYAISLPQSMSRVVKQLETREISLPEVSDALLGYWARNGRRLKDYRDLGQHHALVASDARVVFSEALEPRVYLVLPNNPEVKSNRRLRFSNPTIHAFSFLLDEFAALACLTARVTTVLATKLGASDHPMMRISFREPLTLGAGTVQEGFTSLSDEQIELEILHRFPPGC
jgi:hypothetical protein